MGKGTVEEMTFDELTECASVRIHSALLEGGGKSMKAAVHLWLSQAIVWNKAQRRKDGLKALRGE